MLYKTYNFGLQNCRVMCRWYRCIYSWFVRRWSSLGPNYSSARREFA